MESLVHWFTIDRGTVIFDSFPPRDFMAKDFRLCRKIPK
jgi:hypothetical protein